MPTIRSLRLPAASALAAVACLALLPAAAGAAAPADPPRVVVSIPPLAWFVGEVAGDLVEVSVLLGPGDSPHTFEPTPRQIAGLADADLFLAAGVPFERGLRPRIAALPGGPRVAGPLADAHGHGDAHDHAHGDGLDPHAWLSPAGAAAIGDTVAAALLCLLPDQADAFAAGRARLQQRIAAADAAAQAALAGRRGGIFMVFHPAFGHFAAAYGLQQLAIEAGGHEPGARRLAEVTTLARDRGVGAVVVQPQFSRRAAEAVAASLGVPVLVLDPLAADWDDNFVRIARALAGVLGRAPCGSARP
ncbi:MAG: zinc ABC transporter substrate-binding protein [Candidatus Krumholzibacteriia bacterium]